MLKEIHVKEREAAGWVLKGDYQMKQDPKHCPYLPQTHASLSLLSFVQCLFVPTSLWALKN